MAEGNKAPVKEEPKLKIEEKDEVLEKAQKILAEYGGLEGSIPTDNEYWGLMNQYRASLNREKEK